MGLRHVRPHEQNAVTVRQVSLISWWPPAAERGAQTGHRGGVSYPRLVLDRHHAQPAAEEFLDEVVLFVVDGRPAERAEALDVVEQRDLPRSRTSEVGVAGVSLTRWAIRSIAQSSDLVSHLSEYGARASTCVTRCGLTVS